MEGVLEVLGEDGGGWGEGGMRGVRVGWSEVRWVEDGVKVG